MSVDERIDGLRQWMKTQQIDAVYLGTTDPHQGEEVAPHWCAAQWLSGFTGTSCFCAVTRTEAAFWTDGRYTAQMEKEVDGSIFQRMNTSLPDTPGWMDWVVQNTKTGAVIAMDGEVLSIADFRKCDAFFRSNGRSICFEKDFLSGLWSDRIPIPNALIWELDTCYAGEDRISKISRVRKTMTSKGADCYLGCCLDDIAWLTNLRGGDHPLYPIFHGYTLFTPDKVFLFVDEGKISPKLQEILLADGIEVRSRNEVFQLVSSLPEHGTILVDPYKTSVQLYSSIPETVRKIEGLDIVTDLKSRKNPIEQENTRLSNTKECIAVLRFVRSIYAMMEKGPVTEWDLVQTLERCRRLDPEYLEPANLAIIAYGENAALPHYRPRKEAHSVLQPEGMLLFDICAHYLTGTTDLTRVIPLGPCTEEMKTDYTLTLKAHIALATQRFPYGITGNVLDGVSKSVLWNEYRHFGHGTGHGMGYMLYVHEGPGKIITEYASCFPYAREVALDAGMMFSNEPGVYKPGRHGVRLENDLFVQEDTANEFGRFLQFETLTFFPFERSLILTDLLSEKERNWIDSYHAETFQKLSPYLAPDEVKWLREATLPLA